MKEMKRLLAMLLVVVMLVGILPVSAFATEASKPTYVLAGSDFQPTDASNTTGVNLLNAILDKVDDKYTTMDGFLFAGDYDYNYTNSQSGKEALQAAVQAVYGTEMDEVYVQGNHDTDNLVANGTLSPSGANDAEDYGVFVINEKDYMWYNDDEATIKKTAESLDAYLDAKVEAKYDQPIFVVSHLPLHYCMRTQVGGGDGKHANYIFDVLNDAGANGLNIIFMFGHNHSHGWDDPYGGAAIFLTKGDKINIAQNSTTNYNVETLNFTYMNAGYVSYYRNVNAGAETDLSMTVFAITDDTVTIERYTADGLHDLKSAGVANTHASTGSSVDGSCSTNHKGTETYAPDTSVVKSAYTLTLQKYAEETPEEETTAPTEPSGVTSAWLDLDSTTIYTVGDDLTFTKVTLSWVDAEGTHQQELSVDDLTLVVTDPTTGAVVETAAAMATAGTYHVVASYVIDGVTATGSEPFDVCAADVLTGNAEGVSVSVSSSVAGSVCAEVVANDTITAAMAAKGITNFTAYDITTENELNLGNKASVTLPIPAGMDAANFVVYHIPTEGEPELMPGSASADGTAYTFTTTHFSTYVGGEARATAEGGEAVEIDPDNWVTITAPTGGTTTYTYTQATSITAGKKYVIVGNDHAIALQGTTSMGTQSVAISGDTMTSTTALTEWTFSDSSSGTIYNGTRYLRYNNSAFSLSTSSTTFTITDNGSNFRIQSGNYSFYYNGSSWTRSGKNTAQYVRLYQLTDTTTTGGSNGLYGTIVGNDTYTVTVGTPLATAMAMVKEGITVYYTDDDTATTGTVFDDDGEGMTWTCSTDALSTTGNYPVTIAYNGVTLGTVTIKVEEKAATKIVVSPMSGKVSRGSGPSAETGSTMTVTYEDGTTATIPVTLSMLTGTYNVNVNGTYSNLTVSYGGQQTAAEYTLQVVNVAGNDFPTYPNAGSVDVTKTASGLDFQNTGLARVNLSTSGLPAGKGADVVVVIDTSSSMKDNKIGSKTRIEVLSESLNNMLTQFQQSNSTTGLVPNVDIAIIDFNGYFPSSAGSYDQISLTNTSRDNADYAKVFTGANAGQYIKNVGVSANDFVKNTTIDADVVAGYFTNNSCQSGTNYDGALENAYKLLAAKKTANAEAGEVREQYVIFLSDGAPFRYNGFNNGSDKNTYNTWNNWLQGSYASKDQLPTDSASDAPTYGYFYNGNGTNHPHRIAEAIKGNSSQTYDVVLREAATNTPAYIEKYQGLGAKIYSIGFGLADDGTETGKKVTVATQQELIQVISSGEGYYYPNVQSADELTSAFTQIVTGISYAATNAVFADQMGTAFDLQMNPTVKTNAAAGGTQTVDTSITVTTQAVYTTANAPTTNDVGKTYGAVTEVEKVSFTVVDGQTIATSTAKTEADGNILNDGVIEAKSFFYNTTSQIKTITLEDGSTYDLPGETFYWNIGTINEKRYTLSYVVYLEGSMDGERAAGSYNTNNYATLSYTNYLGNDVSQDVASPYMPWGGANVSYAFYLVDSNGNPLLEDGTQAPNFLTAYKVTQPVLYKTINLNAGETVLSAIGKEVLPDGYMLYDETAAYTVNVASGSGNSNWHINYDTNKTQSTYVINYTTTDDDYSNAIDVSDSTYDYTNTTVYFAVVWTIGTLDDTVVIDFGLPVDISVLANDMLAGKGTLAGVGATKGTNGSTSLATGFGNSYTSAADATDALSFGDVKIEGSKVRYTPNTTAMNTFDRFSYAAQYNNDKYYYGNVTVIPATTVYYEDNFLTYTASNTEWVKANGNNSDVVTQNEDRPGKYSLPSIDANSVYGYDSAYTSFSEHSLDNAMKVTVDSDSYATASFSFYGTGFDVIGLTSNTTGVLWVKVYQDGATDPYKSAVVNTYYGYTRNDEGKWVLTNTANNALYQVPVMQIEELPYGKYTVEITASYVRALDKTNGVKLDEANNFVSSDGYDLYLDAVRIYNPAGTGDDVVIDDVTISDIYAQDGEGWPMYEELRNKIISKGDFDTATTGNQTSGAIFIDHQKGTYSITDYASYGPNNELYLAQGQAVAFDLDLSGYIVDKTGDDGNPTKRSIVADVQIGLKSADGNNVKVTLNAGGAASSHELSTSTDMYYSFAQILDLGTDTTDTANDSKSTVVITNSGTSGIVSITNIKVTFKENPNGVSTSDLLTWNRETGETALLLLADSPEDVLLKAAPIETIKQIERYDSDETEPKEETPEAEAPQVNAPEAIAPEVAAPEAAAAQDEVSQEELFVSGGFSVSQPETYENETQEAPGAVEVETPEALETEAEAEAAPLTLRAIIERIFSALTALFSHLFR